ncbi:MAG TPA: DUF3105 domain-containing protein [Egibacteraceae bacterium]|nr:DUF3105 domain-containing protein [Egibacteraceae bacterium]
MADQQGADGLSKRERQKARGQQRRQQEMAKARREETTSRLLRLIGLLVVLGLLGWFVGNWVVDWRRERQLISQAEERLEELGCDNGGIQPDQGAGHIEDPAAVVPKAIYPDRPASSGPHFGSVVRSGVFDELVDERVLVHNLEHGYVNVYYAEDAPEEQVAELKRIVGDKIGGSNPKMIVAPKIGEWSSDANFAFVAWRYRQMCEEFDEGVLLKFVSEHYGLQGIAPEKTVPAHMGGQGVLDPDEDEGPLLLPPLTPEDLDPDAPAASPSPAPDAEGTQEPAEATTEETAGG